MKMHMAALMNWAMVCAPPLTVMESMSENTAKYK